MAFEVASVIFSCLGVLGALAVAAVFIWRPQFRAFPSIIILLISIADFFLVRLRLLLRCRHSRFGHIFTQ